MLVLFALIAVSTAQVYEPLVGPTFKVPTFNAVQAYENGKLIPSTDVPTNSKLEIQIIGNNLENVHEIGVSAFSNCQLATKFQARTLTKELISVSTTLSKFDSVYYFCLYYKENALEKSSLCQLQNCQIKTKKDNFYKDLMHIIRCVFAGGVTCFL